MKKWKVLPTILLSLTAALFMDATLLAQTLSTNGRTYSNPVLAPSGTYQVYMGTPGTPTLATTTGTCSGTYYYGLSALDTSGNVTAAGTLASISPSSQGVTITVPSAIAGAASYNYWRSTSSSYGSGTWYYTNFTGTTATDSACTGGTSGTPPTSTTALAGNWGTGPLMTVTGVTDAMTPYTVLSTDSVIFCQGNSNNITVNLPAATGSHRLLYIKDRQANTSGTKYCIAAPHGSDTIDTVNANYYVQAGTLFYDTAAGQWDVPLSSSTNLAMLGQGLYGSADISIGSSATKIYGSYATARTSQSVHQIVTGQVELAYAGSTAGNVTALIGMNGNGSGSPNCAEDMYLMANQSYGIFPVDCDIYIARPTVGSNYTVNIYLQTSLAGVTAKYKDSGGNGWASRFQVILAEDQN